MKAVTKVTLAQWWQ